MTKTTPPPELRDDILTELCRIPVKPRMRHPHQHQENFIKDNAFDKRGVGMHFLFCTPVVKEGLPVFMCRA